MLLIRWFQYGSGSSILGQCGSMVWMSKNCKNFIEEKNANLVIPRPPRGPSKQQRKPSALKREHPALKKCKFLIFFYFCVLSSVPVLFKLQLYNMYNKWEEECRNLNKKLYKKNRTISSKIVVYRGGSFCRIQPQVHWPETEIRPTPLYCLILICVSQPRWLKAFSHSVLAITRDTHDG